MVKRRVRFTFSIEMIKEPIIYQVGRKFEIVTNIRRADIGESMGWVILELEGDEAEIEKGIDWVSAAGVRVDPAVGDILEG
jgi:ABC-type methionine transport system ATPase subunit